MKSSAAQPSTRSVTEVAKTSAPKLHLLRDLANTTWRMAVPVLLFTGIGIFIDLQAGTKPFVTLLGVIIGFTVAVLLVKRLIMEADREDNEDKS